jgi:hypothetical protein
MRLALALAVAATLLCSCAAGLRAGYGGVEGTVIGWPAGPLGGSTTPARQATLRFVTDAGVEAATATTDTRGIFSTQAGQGRYRVEVHAFGRDSIIMSANGAGYKTSQLYVDIRSGKWSRLDIVVDTGIR